MRTMIVTGITLTLLAGQAVAGSFIDVGRPSSQLTALSHNGRIATGIGGDAWLWNKDRGATTIGNFESANGMNSWGQPVGGVAINSDGKRVAAIAYSNSEVAGGPILIGGYPGGVGFDADLSSAWDTSDTGVVVGLAYDASSNAIAFRWTAAEGMARLPVNRPANNSRANAISADGSTVVGWNALDNGGWAGVVWRNGVALDLIDAIGNPVGEALAVNSDGSVVVGASYFNPDTGGSEAWRWTAATGIQPIGCIEDFGCGPAMAFAVSDDGNVIVGANGAGFDRSATIWTPSGGLQLLSDYVTARGITIPDGWDLASAGGISADGKSIAGWARTPFLNSFVIDLHDTVTEAKVEAHGTINWNDLSSGPFAGIAVGTPVTMTFRITTVDSTEFEPGQSTRYRILLDTFSMTAGAGSQVLVATAFGPSVNLANDYPKSDGIHMESTPTATANQLLEFELFNPGGDLFDSDDLDRINRTFGPEFFEKISWNIEANGGSQGMYMDLQSVRIEDFTDSIFKSGFDSSIP